MRLKPTRGCRCNRSDDLRRANVSRRHTPRRDARDEAPGRERSRRRPRARDSRGGSIARSIERTRARESNRIHRPTLDGVAMAPTTCADCGVPTKGYARCFKCNANAKRRRDSDVADDVGGRPGAAVRGDEYKFKSAGGGVKTATAIAEHFSRELSQPKITPQKINRVLESLGWIARSPYDAGGWESTKAGLRNGASNHTAMSGVPYVKFEERVLREPALRRALSELSVPTQATQTPTQTQTMNEAVERRVESECRCACGRCSIIGKTQKYKTRDGHYVRSRGEVLIDNFLYSTRVPHAYELELHLAENKVMTPDFCCLTAKGNVYIEFWGLEGQADYDSCTAYKKKLYDEFDLDLINVHPENLDDLDAYLSKKLAQYGVRTAY